MLRMVNGAAAALVELDPVTIPAQEKELGEATAAAVAVLCAAVQSYAHAGELTREIKSMGSERIARVARLQLDHEGGDQDFIAMARRAGMQVLRQRLNGAFDPAQCDATLDFYLDNLFDIVSRVVRDERAFRAAAAH
jgi:hypothetical protein